MPLLLFHLLYFICRILRKCILDVGQGSEYPSVFFANISLSKKILKRRLGTFSYTAQTSVFLKKKFKKGSLRLIPFFFAPVFTQASVQGSEAAHQRCS